MRLRQRCLRRRGLGNLRPAPWTPRAGPRLNSMMCGSGGPPGQENWSRAVGPEVQPPWGKKWKQTSRPCPPSCDKQWLTGSTRGPWRAGEAANVPTRATEASGETRPLRRRGTDELWDTLVLPTNSRIRSCLATGGEWGDDLPGTPQARGTAGAP
ncbi:hypothetical protein NDU88_000262 [Pleurodeles waltl]|uniref:Uncharacterized protein n=1 Tax=Pleurodeles waltl TaxID=8319 RepID=A0AAV7USL6_PLEWA|nr:hypothetical protein NDU88_000262 [Pleurodeles waltl]